VTELNDEYHFNESENDSKLSYCEIKKYNISEFRLSQFEQIQQTSVFIKVILKVNCERHIFMNDVQSFIFTLTFKKISLNKSLISVKSVYLNIITQITHFMFDKFILKSVNLS
jgi:hypothetical protein